MLSSYPEYDSYAPTDYEDDPQYIHIDQHQEAIDTLQNIIDRVKENMILLKEAVDAGYPEEINAVMEEIYGYLEG